MNNLTSEMIQKLSNVVLRFEKITRDKDYSGREWYEEIKYALYLYPDFTATYLLESFNNISVDGFKPPNKVTESHFGTWNVLEKRGNVYLHLIFDDKSCKKIKTENLNSKSQLLEDQIWNCYSIS